MRMRTDQATSQQAIAAGARTRTVLGGCQLVGGVGTVMRAIASFATDPSHRPREQST